MQIKAGLDKSNDVSILPTISLAVVMLVSSRFWLGEL